MQPSDAVKLIYQATFGGGHLIHDEGSVYEYIQCEYAACKHSDKAFYCESLGETARIYLDGELTDTEISLIAKIFCESAKLYPIGFDKADAEVKAKFLAHIDVLRKLCNQGCFVFSENELEVYLTDYASAGYPIVRHSDVYRKAYKPSYRVIHSRYVPLLPLIRKIASLLEKTDNRLIIAIDGRCASGKTTAAELISKLFDAQTVHMDDFFLPPELRYNERLNEIGGNIHYERFADEVLPNLRADTPFTHRVFDCSTFDYSKKLHTISPSNVVIVEGVYSLHPSFGEYYDIAVFADVTHSEQLARIKKRGDSALLQRFENEWIPMEERYFKAFGIQEKCELTI